MSSSLPSTASSGAIPPMGVYGGIQNYGTQSYLPIAERRELQKPEVKKLDQGMDRWWPKIAAGYSTPMTELLASPTKSATLSAIGTGIVLALLGGITLKPRAVFAAIGAVVGAIFGGVTGFLNRRQQNENITDLMSRLPVGATKRDLLADPVYQADLNRKAESASGGGGELLGMAGGMLMSSGNPFSMNKPPGTASTVRNLSRSPRVRVRSSSHH